MNRQELLKRAEDLREEAEELRREAEECESTADRLEATAMEMKEEWCDRTTTHLQRLLEIISSARGFSWWARTAIEKALENPQLIDPDDRARVIMLGRDLLGVVLDLPSPQRLR